MKSKMIKPKFLVDGKNENKSVENSDLRNQIDALLILNSNNKSYNTFACKNVNELEQKISKMNLNDLQSFALQNDILPISERKILENRILKKFKNELSQLRINLMNDNIEFNNLSPKKFSDLT